MGETKVMTSRDGQRTILTSGPGREKALLYYAIAAVVIVGILVAAMMFGMSNESAGVSTTNASGSASPAGIVKD